MGLHVTAAQAAWLVDHHERTIRLQIEQGHLAAVKDGRSWQIDVDALEGIPGWRVNRERLAELQAAETHTAASMAARIAELERSVRELRARLARLEAQSGAPSSSASDSPHTATPERSLAAFEREGDRGYPYTSAPSESAYSASGDVSPDFAPYDLDRGQYRASLPPRERRPVPTLRLAAALPDGLVSAASFADVHRIPQSTMKKAMHAGRLPVVTGRWKSGRAWVAHALDADGRSSFYALWGDTPGFHRCAECPHV